LDDVRLRGEEVKQFLCGNTLECFSSKSGLLEASIEYRTNGTCFASFEDETTDEGQFGFEGDLYWTKYGWFRNGDLFRFFLQRVDNITCQAYFEDGSKAFLQRIKIPPTASLPR